MGIPCAGADSSAHTRAFENGHVSFQFCSRSGRGGRKQLHGLHPQVSLPKKQGAALTWAWPRRVINPEARPLTLLSHFPGAAKAISNSRVGCSHILSAPWAEAEKGVHPEASTPEESLQIGISLHNFHNSVSANQLFTTSLHHKLRDCHCLAR